MKKYGKINSKFTVLFVILIVIVSVLMGTLVYTISYNRSVSTSKSTLQICGKYTADIINPKSIDLWIKDGPDELYFKTEKDLRSIQEEFLLSDYFVYRLVYDEDGNFTNKAVFVYDILPKDATNHHKKNLGDEVENMIEYDIIDKLIETGETQYRERFRPQDREELILAAVPIKNEDGSIDSVVFTSYPMQRVRLLAINTSFGLIVIFDVVLIIFAVIFMILVRKGIIRPVGILSEHMNSFVSGGNEFNYAPVNEIHTNDEIEQMADDFNSMASSIMEKTQELKKATAVHERIRAELDVAASIRKAVSTEDPDSFFAERTDFELFASLKNTVYNSCSFCNYYMTSQEHLYIVMGESVGKTLPALLMSMLASASIRCLAGTGAEPYKIAAEVNDQLCGFERNDKSMTVCALIIDIDLKKGTMKYINAGMPPVLIKNAGEPYKSEENTIQYNLGEMRNVSFSQKTLQLQQGNTLILSSHGVGEMKNSNSERFTMERIIAEINDIASQHYVLSDMITELEKRVDRFRQDMPNELDTTILGFRYFG